MMARHLRHLLPLLCLAAVVTAGHGSFDLLADLNHPYAGSSFSRHEVFRRAARASKDRAAMLTARLAHVLGKGGDISAADVLLAPLSDQGHSLTVGIGTPPQPHTLILDTGSDLIWTQCKLFRHTVRQREPLYDPGKSSSFDILPCSSRLCQQGQFSFKNCSKNRCLYDDVYGSAEADGFLASETFTFGVHSKVSLSLGFGCGALSAGSLVGASGIMGLSPGTLSLISQLSIPRFSYCLTPFDERKTSRLLFGAMADLQKYKTTGPIQTTSILRNPVETAYYYVPLVGLSLGTKRLEVPASSLAINPDGSGGTIVDSGSTIASLVETAFKAVKKAVLETVKLPVVNGTVEDYELCFALPRGVAMDAVKMPPLLLHFDGGAEMVLPRDNYFQEPRAGLMCLAVAKAPNGFGVSIIGNVQQQNMHVLFDVRNQKFSFAPTQCDMI
ncbi:aspartic proteinase nepenthesin-1-like [Phragmites australis]|uniref:aspartic proteinase nepenthesin-1-like n=1 Tax=Phragmites australis TaxID=29695 RepID=UPI002D78A04D|nr:aspartic proteinase nepenthesin-1-like [Phragmites australis]